MKTLILLSVAVLQIFTSPATTQKQDTFAIYLLANSVEARFLARDAWKTLPLASEPIISEANILAYDFSKHALRLKPETLKRLLRPSVFGTPFVVVVNGERIYTGAFYVPLSSVPFGLPVIVVGGSAQRTAANADVVFIARAYPDQSAATGKDLRSDERIRETLGRLKKLAAL